MSWVRMDDQWPFNRKLRNVEPLDRSLWAMSIAYCSSQNTDGRIDGAMLEMVAFLAGVTKPYEAAERLVKERLWDLDAGGWLVHDYLEFNFSASQREEISAKRAEAGRRGGYAKAGKLLAPSQANGQQDAWQSSSRPVPSRPVPSPDSSSSSGPSHQEPESRPNGTDDDEFVNEVLTALGTADHTKALADGVNVKNRPRHLAACIKGRGADIPRIQAIRADNPKLETSEVAKVILTGSNGLGPRCGICKGDAHPNGAADCPAMNGPT